MAVRFDPLKRWLTSIRNRETAQGPDLRRGRPATAGLADDKSQAQITCEPVRTLLGLGCLGALLRALCFFRKAATQQSQNRGFLRFQAFDVGP
jgi:hypothetical protein